MSQDFCSTRKTLQLTTIPRVELQPSPYINGITQQQLDMRRKVEILKYNSSKSSSQTNSLTRNQIFSKIVSGNFTPCPADSGSKRVSTTASDVPGPPMDLFEDPNIPLYNYVLTRTYGITTSNDATS